MQIDSLFSTIPGSADLYSEEVNMGMGKDDFLKLLIAQIENQNPLSPQEATEFTAQLAQFSSLEKLININDALKEIELIQSSINNAQAVSFIGKNVLSLGNEITITNGTTPDIQYELALDASIIEIDIFDSASNLVRTLSVGSQKAGRQAVPFDGLDKNGIPLPDGEYSYHVSASNFEGDSISVISYSTGKVKGVSFEDGTAVLLVGEHRVPVSYFVEVFD